MTRQTPVAQPPDSASLRVLGAAAQQCTACDLSRLLDKALVAAGITRSEVYLANAVKHFRFERASRGWYRRTLAG